MAGLPCHQPDWLVHGGLHDNLRYRYRSFQHGSLQHSWHLHSVPCRTASTTLAYRSSTALNSRSFSLHTAGSLSLMTSR